MISERTRTSYDDLPYPSHAFPQSHPAHLATIATLLGLEPKSPRHARILELGCASGGNLIPIAAALPDSQCVGVDLSATQIADAQRTVEGIGLQNIDVRHASILDIDPSWGMFDYIICHGVYSWVPAEVQDHILGIMRRQLTPQGIGYISYNTYPGWRMRSIIRDMMGYHDRRLATPAPEARVTQARALLKFLTASVQPELGPYSLLLQEQLNLLQSCSDSYLFHEHLEERNEPLYFLQFCDRLAKHDLRYLGEAEFSAMVAQTSFPEHVQQYLRELAPSLLEMEQYMDFLRNRTFRQTLVCHAEVQPNYAVRGEVLYNLYIAAPLKPAFAVESLANDEPGEFHDLAGATMISNKPIVKAAFTILGELWPASLGFNELCCTASQRLGQSLSPTDMVVAEHGPTLARALLTAYAKSQYRLLNLSPLPPAFTLKISTRPIAFPAARYQAQQGAVVTNLRHESVKLSPLDQHLLTCLDGAHTDDEMLEVLLQRFNQQQIRLSNNDVPVTDPAIAAPILRALVPQRLESLARAALLVAGSSPPAHGSG